MANITDVANYAGVSISTVSHVINHTRYVSEETADRVQAAIKELNYHPNITALSLRTKKTKTIGLMLPFLLDNTSNTFFMQIALGVETELRKNGYFTFLSNTNEDINCELRELENLVSKPIDGLIIVPCMGDHSVVPPVIKEIPVVYVDRRPVELENITCVFSDSESGCYKAVSKQIAMGHKRIGVISGWIATTPNMRERFEGYKRALADHGIPFDESLVIEGDPLVSEGYSLTEKLLRDKGVSSLVILNNCLTIGALQYLKEKKIRVPEDVNVTTFAFDDYDWTSIYNPSLTVIKQRPYDMGREAAQLLVSMLSGKNKKNQVYTLPTDLIERDSWNVRKS